MTSLALLVGTSERIGATPARLAKVRELATLLKALDRGEVSLAALYLSGEIRQGKIGLGHATLQAAAAAPAAAAILSLQEVDDALAALALTRGTGSAAQRGAALRNLFSRATAPEQRFLMALLTGELRQGALAGVMADAIAAAAQLPATEVRRAAMYAPDLGAVATAALLGGGAMLRQFQLQLFAPVAPMLAQTAADVAEALRELPGEVAFEWKMDGARIQVHRQDEQVRIYTRALNEVTAAIPEIVEAVLGLGTRDLILDGEAIAFDDAGRPRPFQVTMRRFGRRLGVEALRSELPLRAYFFDCLRLEGRSLVDAPTSERATALAAVVPGRMRVPRIVTDSQPEALQFYEAALATGHEGVMAKALDVPYEAGNRGAGWLKIKRAHTLDLVVLAAEWGHGRRVGKLSNLHLGALEPATGEYVMLGKTFKGLTDALLEWQTAQLLARETRRDAYTIYARPELVVEVAFSDLQASTRYPGGMALRLARVRRYREDKRPEDADTMESVRRVFSFQALGADKAEPSAAEKSQG